MDLGGEGASVYAEAKAEYTKQLCQYLVPSIQQFFLDLLDEAKGKESDPKRVLVMFQTLLEDISNWNVDKVQRETAGIVTGSQCDYLEELMTAVFIAHTKVLSAIRLTTRQKKLQITIPKLEHFLHRTVTECARLLWSNTYLFSTNAPSIERQKNLRLIENFLHDGVLQGIRGMLPVKNILREYWKEDESGDEEAEAEAEAEAPADAEAEDEAVEAKAKAEAVEVKAAPEPEVKATEPVTDVSQNIVNNDEEVMLTGDDTLFEIQDTDEHAFEDVVEEVKILEGSPEEMDGFEELEKGTDVLEMDFETL